MLGKASERSLNKLPSDVWKNFPLRFGKSSQRSEESFLEKLEKLFRETSESFPEQLGNFPRETLESQRILWMFSRGTSKKFGKASQRSWWKLLNEACDSLTEKLRKTLCQSFEKLPKETWKSISGKLGKASLKKVLKTFQRSLRKLLTITRKYFPEKLEKAYKKNWEKHFIVAWIKLHRENGKASKCSRKSFPEKLHR